MHAHKLLYRQLLKTINNCYLNERPLIKKILVNACVSGDRLVVTYMECVFVELNR